MQSNIYIKKDKDSKEINRSINLGGLTRFWHLQDSNTGYTLTCEDYKKEYASLEEVKKHFISLEEFLRDAKYIGCQFHRTSPIKDEDGELDRSYMQDCRYAVYLALYDKDGIILAYYLNKIFGYHEYVAIPKYYTEDKNYELVASEPTSNLQATKFQIMIFDRLIYNRIIEQESKPKNKELTLKRD